MRRKTGTAVENGHTSGFRGDIQGLRAVAVLLVMLWHAGVTALPGGFIGVDIFLVISGFLMTGILLREFGPNSQRPSLLGFYARRARRLLPASLLTIVVVVLLAWVTLPDSRRSEVLVDALVSTVFSMNWRMAAESVNYFGATTGSPSPLQHFWSLGVEEQFYFFWPIFLVAAFLLAQLFRARPTVLFAVVMTAATLASVGYSIVYTSSNPAQAYFVTGTRIWELAVGGLLALSAASLKHIPRPAAICIGWLGLVLAVAPAILYTDSTPFPGSAAMVPVVGAALIIASGPGAGRFGPGAILSVLPLRLVGNWSYSLYLWHWPVIVFGSAWIGRELSQTEGLVAIALCFIPALAAYYLVEEPIRRGRGVKIDQEALRFAGLGLLGATVLTLSLLATIPKPVPSTGALADAYASLERTSATEDAQEVRVGAQVLKEDPAGDPAGAPMNTSSFYPQPTQIDDTAFGCQAGTTEAQLVTCEYGDPTSDTHVVLAGDSHALQWSRAMAVLANDNGWHLTVMTKDFCPLLSGVPLYSDWLSSCEAWQDLAIAWISEKQPDLMVTSQYDYLVTNEEELLGRADSDRAIGTAQRELFSRITDAGTNIAVISNTPQMRIDILACIERYSPNLTECAVPREDALNDVGGSQLISVSNVRNARLIDLNDAICPTELCAPVIGSVLVYRDNNHMTTTYGESLAPRLGAELQRLF